MQKRGKKAQFQIGFGMIFSMILIVVFIVVAFIAVNAFLGISCSVETGSFIKDLDSEINRIWKGAGENTMKEFKINGCNFEYVCFYDVASNINGEYVSFADDIRIFTGDKGDHNLYFYPRSESDVPSVFVDHVNMDLPNNPYCFKKTNNAVNIRLSKSFNEALVRVS